VSSCCTPRGYERIFGEKLARRDAKRYRRKGLDETARWIADRAIENGIEGATVLEAGGGVGAIQLELLKAGAARSVNVELSPGYEEAAAELARESGLAERIERRLGDVVADEELGEADVVVLHRVVCCYPDYEALLGAAARRARRTIVFSHPPAHAVARLVVTGVNLFLALTRSEFRSYTHPPEALRSVVQEAGFHVVAERRGRIWRAVALTRLATMG